MLKFLWKKFFPKRMGISRDEPTESGPIQVTVENSIVYLTKDQLKTGFICWNDDQGTVGQCLGQQTTSPDGIYNVTTCPSSFHQNVC